MERAIGSKINLKNMEDLLAVEYMNCVYDIIYDERIQKLDSHEQHCHTSRLQHSINVSYYSFLICKFFGFDYKSAARGGLMHDLFFYDWREKKFPGHQNHATWHPKLALKNAKKVCDLNKIEEDCIVKHMWPMTIVPPRYKESFVVSFVDKTCAVFEASGNIFNKTKN